MSKIIAILDPPYGINIVKPKKGSIGYGGKLGFIGAKGTVDVNVYSEIIGDETTETAKKIYNLLLELGIDKLIIWGGNYMTDNFADCEIAWTNFKSPSRIVKHKWSGLLREGSRKLEGIRRLHPTQKPVGMLSEIIKKYTKQEDIVLDLFGGSFSTMIACHQTNRIFYGMEISPVYCDVGIKRILKLDPNIKVSKNGEEVDKGLWLEGGGVK